MGLIAGGILMIVAFAYTFWPTHGLLKQRTKTRADYLEERRETVYENLRDLNFEFKAGKYPREDYEMQRALLEEEAARILNELDSDPNAPDMLRN